MSEGDLERKQRKEKKEKKGPGGGVLVYHIDDTCIESMKAEKVKIAHNQG